MKKEAHIANSTYKKRWQKFYDRHSTLLISLETITIGLVYNHETYKHLHYLVVIIILVTVSFLGSTISISVIELTELESDYRIIEATLKKDSTLISPVIITLVTNGKPIEKTEDNEELAINRIKQVKIQKYLNLIRNRTDIDIINLPEKLIVLLSACFLGLLGMLLNTLKETVYDKKEIFPTEVLQRSLLGFLSGVLVVVLSYVIPSIITQTNELKIRTETLISFSLLVGIFFEPFLNKLKQRS